ncbi:MAG: hypothetical protein A2566_02210 [Candidatus Zambryskibacteria bacterium RIFOXYD1_FULL_40_13]|nr:MAG: Glycosyl transferase family 2 [Parcubacteria group bacterium GW2011_GWC1_39_12]KKR19027.1 MAG: Glycosyl transferase family 2 [Parcubacteria group bacterium GW2011_GWF1_39_37]KKR35594.1 MAG: Glycosyl transferase family 2 [Parcubacteria group bacterium GW2011_GWC2_40_10]KKR52005.1 MAG: Glycosyl transferase family 2 [Parcubacteria group bacterium GW2011_GWE1_40_20]KKR68803.1 MAG: Glycosyl transferase family 2 [Parcubacteria group bacterium GW2011_GWF2_40_69]KKR80142.1 MAG: Glycosyl transf
MSDQHKPELSVVILCYKAGEFAQAFVAQVEKVLEEHALNSYQLVLVANYNGDEVSSDITPNVVKGLAQKNSKLKVVSMVKKGMMGWDMRSGFEAADGKNIAVIDGDNQMPPKDIVRVYQALKLGNYDMVKTYRQERHDGTWRFFISTIYNFLLKVFFPRVKVRDANSKPKIFTREALEKLKLTSNDWFIDAEIIIQASRLNFSIKEIPTIFYVNKQRSSFLKFKAILEFISNLIRYRIKMFKGTLLD